MLHASRTWEEDAWERKTQACVCSCGSGIQVSEGGGDGERGFGDEVTYGCGAGSSPTPALLGRNGGKSASRTVRQTGAADGLVKRP